MDGKSMRAIRGERSGDEFAKMINSALGKRTDKHKISRWETGANEIPPEVEGLLRLWTLKFTSTGVCRVIAVALQKGGVLKTTSAVNLAYVLAMAGARVLLLDADSQANATSHVGFDENTIDDLASHGRTLYHAVTGKIGIEDIIIETTVPNIHIAPSSIHLALCELETNDGSSASKMILKKLLNNIRDEYDFIIIDTSPSLGIMTVNSLVAADQVLIPVQVERFAVVGLRHLLDTINSIIDNLNPKLSVLGVQDRETLEELKLGCEDMVVFDPVQRSSYFAKASAGLTIPYKANPGATGLETFIQIAETLGVISNG